MPAVQLARLKSQITELNWKFSRPAEFKNALKELFSLYSDHVFRPGKTSSPAHLINSYHVPPILMRQLEIDLSPHCKENPAAALAIAEILLSDTYIESQRIAAAMIGMTPLSEIESVLAILNKWCTPRLERQALASLLEQGTITLRKKAPDQWFQLIERWLTDPKASVQAIGLRALIPAIHDVDFENLPQIYHLITPILLESVTSLQPDFLNVLSGLTKRSETETSFFLRQIIVARHSENTIRLIRKAIPQFSPEQQAAIRAALTYLPTTH